MYIVEERGFTNVWIREIAFKLIFKPIHLPKQVGNCKWKLKTMKQMHFNLTHLFFFQFYLIHAYTLIPELRSSCLLSRPFTGYQKQTLTLHLAGKALRTSWHHVDSQPVGQPDNPPACEVASESCKWQAASAAAMAKAKATAVATCSSAVDKNTICQSGKYLWAKCKRDAEGVGWGAWQPPSFRQLDPYPPTTIRHQFELCQSLNGLLAHLPASCQLARKVSNGNQERNICIYMLAMPAYIYMYIYMHWMH